ncbi:hypothetical protein ABK040_003228 [Willaertia magna]
MNIVATTTHNHVNRVRLGKAKQVTPFVPKTNTEPTKVGREKFKSKLKNLNLQYKSGNQRLNPLNNKYFKNNQLNTTIGMNRNLFILEKKAEKEKEEKIDSKRSKKRENSNTKKWHSLERGIYQEKNCFIELLD